jgi:hypothetical protein
MGGRRLTAPAALRKLPFTALRERLISCRGPTSTGRPLQTVRSRPFLPGGRGLSTHCRRKRFSEKHARSQIAGRRRPHPRRPDPVICNNPISRVRSPLRLPDVALNASTWLMASSSAHFRPIGHAVSNSGSPRAARAICRLSPRDCHELPGVAPPVQQPAFALLFCSRRA